jgi:coenzyme F420-reducing hydrogenase delta subunit
MGIVMGNDSYIVDFEEVLERINNLEEVVNGLLNPELMYRRPGAAEHEKLIETLDYLHKKVAELESKCTQ